MARGISDLIRDTVTSDNFIGARGFGLYAESIMDAFSEIDNILPLGKHPALDIKSSTFHVKQLIRTCDEEERKWAEQLFEEHEAERTRKQKEQEDARRKQEEKFAKLA